MNRHDPPARWRRPLLAIPIVVVSAVGAIWLFLLSWGVLLRVSPQSLRVTPRRREKWDRVACRRRRFLGSCEPVGQPGAGARPRRVTHCCFEHADQNFGSP